MKLYPIPGGTWAGTEIEWKKALIAAGLDHKKFRTADGKPVTREVPTGKAELIEFLNFFAVDVYRTGDAANIVVGVDPEELQRRHNPDAPDLPPQTNADRPAGAGADTLVAMDSVAFDDEFQRRPIMQQLSLAVIAIDTASDLLKKSAA